MTAALPLCALSSHTQKSHANPLLHVENGMGPGHMQGRKSLCWLGLFFSNLIPNQIKSDLNPMRGRNLI